MDSWLLLKSVSIILFSQKMIRLLAITLIVLNQLLLSSGCSDHTESGGSSESEPITIKDAYGLTPRQIEDLWKRPLTEVEGSFSILVSKNLHPYVPPEGNRLMRYGDSYLVLEFSENRLVSIHPVSG